MPAALLRSTSSIPVVVAQIYVRNMDNAKRAAAQQAVDDCIHGKMTVGIGSGSTVVFAVERLAQNLQYKSSGDPSVICVPTSFQARQLIIKYGLVLGDLDRYPILDVVIDGADEVDQNLVLIKGGGGCLLQEKIVASCASQMIVIADHTKNSKELGDNYKKGIPIEVIPMAYVPIKERIEKEFGGTVELRMALAKAGPCVTDNGNFILDWKFNKDGKVFDWEVLGQQLKCMPGVVETGLFVGMATKVYFGLADGKVEIRYNKNNRNL